MFGITRQTRVNSELFNTFIIRKKISYHINNVSKKKKGLNTYLRPVSLSNSIWYAKNCRAIRPSNKLFYRINVLRIILIRIQLVLLISSGIAGKGGLRERNLCARLAFLQTSGFYGKMFLAKQELINLVNCIFFSPHCPAF